MDLLLKGEFMRIYQYTHPQQIESTDKHAVIDESGEVVCYIQRQYSNSLKKFVDRVLEYRYFVQYDVKNNDGSKIFSCKKIVRKGRMWFEGIDFITNKKVIITYENWRLGIPNLTILEGNHKIRIDKEMEEWSQFVYEERVIAKWKANFIDEQFQMILQIEEESPIQNVAFFIAISQAALFVGA